VTTGSTVEAPVAAELVRLAGVEKSFARPGAKPLAVLEGVDLTLSRGEILGVLGRSGSGKSTLLRIIAGLTPATAGTVTFKGGPITGPPPGVAMVFQSFALMPWLTVLENVQLGLEALGLPQAEVRSRSVGAIDLIGLDGFEQAYTRELSGGMRQRVGLARAIVVHPEVLLMDEPFSALDVLTAETLRTDLLELWTDGQLPIGAIVLVTHSIEEAVLMCDRVVVFSSKPGRVVIDLPIDLPRPRDRSEPRFAQLVERLYTELVGAPRVGPPVRPADRVAKVAPYEHLPKVAIGLATGLLEALVAPPYGGRADLPVLAGALQLEVDDLFPVADALQLLGFAHLEEGDLVVTGLGEAFVDADGDERKALFAAQLLERVGLVGHVLEVLGEREDHRAPYARFSSELEDHLAPAAAEETLRTAITWGRYAELFSYDDRTQMLGLEDVTA